MDKNLTYRQCLSHLWKFLKPNQKKLWTALILIVIMNVIYVLIPTWEGKITTQLQMDLNDISNHVAGAHIQMDVIIHILMTLGLFYVIKISSQFLSTFLLTDAIQKTMYDIRQAILHKINMLPVSYFDSHLSGDLLSRITNDVETVSNALQQTLARVITFVCTLVLVTSMMLSISPFMTLIVWLSAPFLLFFSGFLVKKSQPVFDDQQEALANMNETINELYTGSHEILNYSRQAWARERFSQVNKEMRKKGFKSQLISGLISPLSSLVTYIVIGICCLYGCLQVLSGTLMLGQLQAFIRYIWNLSDPLAQVSQLSSAIQSAFSGMNRLFTFLSLPEEAHPVTKSPVGEVETIGFDHVKFSYTDQPLMEDVSFNIHKGQMVAVVGPTGAGKTTLTNLLLRFYDVKDGQICINGQNIQDISRQDLRGLFGMVLQDPWLFEGTVKDNLLFAREDASDEDLRLALVHAGLDEKILNHPVGENADNFSQGEKQLLTIARALLKNPQILILDEATSSVDTRMERKIQQATRKLMEGRTSFVIAHRLSTIINADWILVMKNGDITEQGTHQSLLGQGGLYASLYNSQFQDMDEMDA